MCAEYMHNTRTTESRRNSKESPCNSEESPCNSKESTVFSSEQAWRLSCPNKIIHNNSYFHQGVLI